MNYRHIYHAGSFSDVFKHAVLCLLIGHLRQKETAFAVLDTHAGRGKYDLLSEETQKTGEYHGGIEKLLQAPNLPQELLAYTAIVRSFNHDGKLRWYPGSPRIARTLLRKQDRLEMVELHPGDITALRHEFGNDAQVNIHHADGFMALNALLPPKENRGLVIIDPAFEVENEFDRILEGLAAAHNRFSHGIYAVWYPVKERARVQTFHDKLYDVTGFAKILVTEFMVAPEDNPDRLNGCSMVIINPPWRLDETISEKLAPFLLQALGCTETGRAETRWIAGG